MNYIPVDAASVSSLAVVIGDYRHVDLLQSGGLGAARGCVPPARHRRQLVREQRAGRGRETHGRGGGGEVQRGGKSQDGEVKVRGGVVVAGVRGDGGDAVSVRQGVAGVVLAHQHLDGGGGVAVGAVRRREHVLAGDYRASAPGSHLPGVHQRHHPGVLVHLRLLSTNDSCLPLSNSTVTS